MYTKWRFCPLGSRTWTNEDPRQSHSQQPLTRKEDPWLHFFIGTSDTRTPEPRTWPYRPRGPYGATFLILLLVRPSAPCALLHPARNAEYTRAHASAGCRGSSIIVPKEPEDLGSSTRSSSWSGGEPPPHGHRARAGGAEERPTTRSSRPPHRPPARRSHPGHRAGRPRRCQDPRVHVFCVLVR